jgi:hypothetical protein
MSDAPPPPPAPIPVTAAPHNSGMISSVRRDIRGFNKNQLREVDKNIRGEKIIVERGISSYHIPDDEDKTEYFDSEEDVKKKIKQLAEYVKNCKHMVALTGAGISQCHI